MITEHPAAGNISSLFLAGIIQFNQPKWNNRERPVLSVVASDSLDVISAVSCFIVALEKADEATSND